MKLLLDENLSYRLVVQLEAAFPGSQHVDSVGLHSQSDATIWEFARDNGFTIVSKDDDFRQLALLHGAPPKVIWLVVGNAGTDAILQVLRDRHSKNEAFFAMRRKVSLSSRNMKREYDLRKVKRGPVIPLPPEKVRITICRALG